MPYETALPRDLKAVFFDIGGTLVGPNLGLLARWLRTSGIACEDDQVCQVEPAARRAHAELRHAVVGTPAIRGLYTREVIRRLWADRPDDPIALETAANRVLATAIAAGYPVVPVWNEVLPGVADGLATLRARGLPLIAVSNSDGSAESVLAAAGLRELFDAVIDSHHVGFAKPDPRIFDAARAVLGVSADTVVHVGDQYDADVVGAQAAGIAPLLIDGEHLWPEAGCARADDFAGAIRALTGDTGS